MKKTVNEKILTIPSVIFTTTFLKSQSLCQKINQLLFQEMGLDKHNAGESFYPFDFRFDFDSKGEVLLLITNGSFETMKGKSFVCKEKTPIRCLRKFFTSLLKEAVIVKMTHYQPLYNFNPKLTLQRTNRMRRYEVSFALKSAHPKGFTLENFVISSEKWLRTERS